MEYIKQYSYATDMRTLTGSKMGCQEVSYLEDGKHLLMENSSVGSGGEGKSGKPIPKESKPPSVSGEDFVHKLLTTNALLRHFKINRQIGELEQKDKLSFTSLVRQIQMGLVQGYVESDIVNGVIHSITHGMVLHSYLETYKDLTLDQLKKVLHSQYGAKNTSELYQTLASIYRSARCFKMAAFCVC